MVHNMLRIVRKEGKPNWHYNGYTACPVLTGYKKMLLMEYGYGKKLMPTQPLSVKPRFYLYLVKRYGLSWIYWNLIPKGLWELKHYDVIPEDP